MLAEAIVGREIRGSWMADPEVFRIHRLVRGVSKHPSIFSAPLILGKETLFDASLGAAVQRFAVDPVRREVVTRSLSEWARGLLVDVERMGEVRMDRWRQADRWKSAAKRGRAARHELELQLLVRSEELHTEQGYHTAIVSSWATSPLAQRFAGDAIRLGYEDAQNVLFLAAVRAAVVAPEREAQRWLAVSPDERLFRQGKILRWVAENRSWLTAAP
jgi:hypothetical protein